MSEKKWNTVGTSVGVIEFDDDDYSETIKDFEMTLVENGFGVFIDPSYDSALILRRKNNDD